MKTQSYKNFSEIEKQTWRSLFERLVDNRQSQAHPIFTKGVELLGLNADNIPKLDEVNHRLMKLTGWQGVPVEGLEGADSFYPALAERKFPIGNFIREADDINYTPAPDIFHDLYGHLPFLTDKRYADFCQKFGEESRKFVNQPEKMRMFERVFWFAVEFPLIETENGRRIFGGGLLSSFGESNYSLSDEPNVMPFDLDVMAHKEFEIDHFQEDLFVLENEEQLYDCLPELVKIVNAAKPSH